MSTAGALAGGSAVDVVLVNEDDDPVGTMAKVDAHRAPGHLHRAISVCIFDADGRVLLQQRAASKYHFAGRWSNACCSHPLPGEAPLAAAERRSREELGIGLVDGIHCGTFVYRAEDPTSGLVEHELDHVIAGMANGSPALNPAEVSGIRWYEPGVEPPIAPDSTEFTPWLPSVMRLATAGWAERPRLDGEPHSP